MPQSFQALTPNPVTEPKLEVIPKVKDWEQFVKDNDELYLDTETYSIGDKNPMNNLGLRTIQLGNNTEERHYLKWEHMNPGEREKLIHALTGKRIYLFNLNFDTSQLKHAGFNIDSNTWYDIALLARITWNDRVDKGRMSLASWRS